MNSSFGRGVLPPFVGLDGTKVSKSLGNHVFDLCREWDTARPARPRSLASGRFVPRSMTISTHGRRRALADEIRSGRPVAAAAGWLGFAR